MSDDIKDLYHDLILDHCKHPRNFGHLDQSSHSAKGHNPLCGDSVEVELRLEDGIISAAKFTGVGCAISIASASLMTQCIVGQTLEQSQIILDAFRQIVMKAEEPATSIPGLEDLLVFSGVNKFPMRVKCATLAWHTLQSALQSD